MQDFIDCLIKNRTQLMVSISGNIKKHFDISKNKFIYRRPFKKNTKINEIIKSFLQFITFIIESYYQ